MEAKIIQEIQCTEDLVYFEAIPVDVKYQDKFKFGKEVVLDINDIDALELTRAQIINEANDCFDNNLKHA
jgi:hypothetical protein